jgi:hypothetical protein
MPTAVGNISGLASFLKALSGDQLKFVLVGIGQSLSDLDLDHPSIERHMWPVLVPRMKRAELNDLVNRALLKLSASSIHGGPTLTLFSRDCHATAAAGVVGRQ